MVRILLAAALLATVTSGPPPVQRPKGLRPGTQAPPPRPPPAERVPEPSRPAPPPEPSPPEPPQAEPPQAEPLPPEPPQAERPPAEPSPPEPPQTGVSPPELPPPEPVAAKETPGFEIPPEPKSTVPSTPSGSADPFDASVPPPAPRRRIDPIDLPPPRSSRRPPPPPPPPPSVLAARREGAYRRLSAAVTPSVEYAVTYLPGTSASFGMFLGSVLRPRKSRHARPWRTALGYQFDIGYDATTTVLMRHRLMATGHGGDRGRLFHQLGCGIGTDVEGSALLGAVARMGIALPAPEWRLNGFVVGGSVAMDSFIGEDPIPILRLGIFLGWAWI